MYGEGRNWRYIIGFAAVIILLFVIIFMIVKGGGGDSKGKVPETQKALTSYSNNDDITVTAHTIGPITAPENHNEIEINVTNTQATINIINGYDDNIVNSRSYPLTTEAFSEFLSALDKAGFTNGNTDEKLKDDSGYCATGQRYIFSIRDGANEIQRFWTTSCGGTKTYKGNRSATLSLFQNQIPNYGDLTQDVRFSSSSIF